MIKAIIKAIYTAFLSIVLISIVLVGWTGYALVFQSSKSSEIIKVIQDMYASQKSIVIDVIDLSKILIRDKPESISSGTNNLLVETELQIDLEENSPIDEAPNLEDTGDNPLGIVIEPSLPDLIENNLPEINEEPLVNEKSELSSHDIEMSMDMNS